MTLLKPEIAILIILLAGGIYFGCHSETRIHSTTQQPPSTSFVLTPNPSYMTVTLGSSISSNITVSSVNGFSGIVTFSQPATQTGTTATLSTHSVSVSPSNPGTTILNVTVGGPIRRDAHDCIYGCLQNVTVTGSTGSSFQTASIRVLVYIPNFWLYADQNLVIVDGASGHANLSLVSEFYSGNVSFRANTAPAGPRVTFHPSSILLTLTGGGHSEVTIDTAWVLTGNYNVTVTATAVANQSLSHRVTLYVTVWMPQPASPQPGILSFLLNHLPYAVILVVLASFLVITALSDRRARKLNPSREVSSRPVIGQV